MKKNPTPEIPHLQLVYSRPDGLTLGAVETFASLEDATAPEREIGLIIERASLGEPRVLLTRRLLEKFTKRASKTVRAALKSLTEQGLIVGERCDELPYSPKVYRWVGWGREKGWFADWLKFSDTARQTPILAALVSGGARSLPILSEPENVPDAPASGSRIVFARADERVDVVALWRELLREAHSSARRRVREIATPSDEPNAEQWRPLLELAAVLAAEELGEWREIADAMMIAFMRCDSKNGRLEREVYPLAWAARYVVPIERGARRLLAARSERSSSPELREAVPAFDGARHVLKAIGGAA